MGSITETIAATLQDGYEKDGTATWYNAGPNFQIYIGYSFGTFHSGFRFQTIGINKNDTIDDATLTVKVNAGDADTDATMFAHDVDDAVDFGDADLPTGTVYTTASKNVPAGDFVAYTLLPVDVKTIVQELVDRGGWAYDNDMRFVFIANNTSGYERSALYEYDSDYFQEIKLEVNFTAAGGVEVLRRRIEGH